MTEFELIVTHPGGAHKDEFLACSVLLALHAVPLVRREPTPEDLASATVCVVDVGHRHEPARNNFDHHQLPADHPPTCSLSLILQDLELYADARRFCDWLETAEWFDCRGAVSTAQWLGIDPQVLSRLSSVIDLTLLRRFALARRLEPSDPLAVVMRMIGEDLLEHIKTLRARLDFIGRHAEIWRLDLRDGPAKILFLPRTDPLPDEPSFGLDQFIASRNLGGEVIGLIYPDRRSTGYGLSRFHDNKRLDFTRISQSPLVHFTHARGFVAKTSTHDVAHLRDLIIQAGQ